jgi:single-stranded DNA-binding protein
LTFHVDKLIGNVTNVPEVKTIGNKNTPLKELNVAVNHQRKNKDSGEYEKTGDTSWITVKLWGERAQEDFVKGDLIEFAGSLVEKAFKRNDGTDGRRLETDYVESISIKYPSKDRSAPVGATADAGFTPAPTGGDGW